MPLIGEQDRATIAEMFQELTNPVRMVLFTIPTSALYVPGRATCETCDQVQQLTEELADISDKVTLEVHHFENERDVARQYGITQVPALVLERPVEDGEPDHGRIRYYGAPAGYEFSTLLNDIQLMSRGETELAPQTREVLSAIEEPLHIQVFVTPT
jgi:alkyl hydroperoxide reductase subunit AhpF